MTLSIETAGAAHGCLEYGRGYCARREAIGAHAPKEASSAPAPIVFNRSRLCVVIDSVPVGKSAHGRLGGSPRDNNFFITDTRFRNIQNDSGARKDIAARIAERSLPLTLSGVSALVATDSLAHGRSKSPQRLEGAWEVTVTPYVCATGELLPAFATPTYMTFGARGTLAEK